MLEFIVSGQIPGTQIIITFQWVMLLASLLLGAALVRSINRREYSNRADNPQLIEEITL